MKYRFPKICFAGGSCLKIYIEPHLSYLVGKDTVKRLIELIKHAHGKDYYDEGAKVDSDNTYVSMCWYGKAVINIGDFELRSLNNKQLNKLLQILIDYIDEKFDNEDEITLNPDNHTYDDLLL